MQYKKLTFKIKSKKPYLFIGSKIRGMFGYALKEEVCINPTYLCKGCFAIKECLFYKLYEAQNTTQPYRLDFKLYDNEYKFSLFIFENMQKDVAVIRKALESALKKEKYLFTCKEKQKKIQTKKQKSKLLKITFLTPLRIKKNNKFLTRSIDLLTILLSAHRRYNDLQNKKTESVYFNNDYSIVMQKLYFKELIRKSNKQNTKMNLGGIMGEMIINNVSEDIFQLLKIAQIIGVGKASSFGLGKIKVEEIE